MYQVGHVDFGVELSRAFDLGPAECSPRFQILSACEVVPAELEVAVVADVDLYVGQFRVDFEVLVELRCDVRVYVFNWVRDLLLDLGQRAVP